MSETYNGWTHEKILESLACTINDMDEFEHYGIGDELYDIVLALKTEWGVIPCWQSLVKREALRYISEEIDELFVNLQYESKIKSGDILPKDEYELKKLEEQLAELISKVICYQKDLQEVENV